MPRLSAVRPSQPVGAEPGIPVVHHTCTTTSAHGRGLSILSMGCNRQGPAHLQLCMTMPDIRSRWHAIASTDPRPIDPSIDPAQLTPWRRSGPASGPCPCRGPSSGLHLRRARPRDSLSPSDAPAWLSDRRRRRACQGSGIRGRMCVRLIGWTDRSRLGAKTAGTKHGAQARKAFDQRSKWVRAPGADRNRSIPRRLRSTVDPIC